MNRDIIAFTKYKFNVYGNKDIRSGKDSAVVGIVGKSKSLDFPTMLIFWSLVRNSVVLAVYLLFSVACFLTVHEHLLQGYHYRNFSMSNQFLLSASEVNPYFGCLVKSYLSEKNGLTPRICTIHFDPSMTASSSIVIKSLPQCQVTN